MKEISEEARYEREEKEGERENEKLKIRRRKIRKRIKIGEIRGRSDGYKCRKGKDRRKDWKSLKMEEKKKVR